MATERHVDDMKSSAQNVESPAQLIEARIKELGDWRGKTLSRLRALIKQADPEVVEEWKWRKPSRAERCARTATWLQVIARLASSPDPRRAPRSGVHRASLTICCLCATIPAWRSVAVVERRSHAMRTSARPAVRRSRPSGQPRSGSWRPWCSPTWSARRRSLVSRIRSARERCSIASTTQWRRRSNAPAGRSRSSRATR